MGVIARVPIAFGALSGRFTPQTRFYGDDHRRNLYAGEGLKTALRKVEKLKFLASKSMSLSEAAIKWTLNYPAVSTSIPGIRNLNQATINCAAGDGERISTPTVRKSEKLYRSNFGLPITTLSSDDGIQAVFMSGVRLIKSSKRKLKKVPGKRNQARKSLKIRKTLKKGRSKKKKK